MPTCHDCDIKMAVHMDDPPWDIFGLPRLLTSGEAIDKFLAMVNDPYNYPSRGTTTWSPWPR